MLFVAGAEVVEVPPRAFVISSGVTGSKVSTMPTEASGMRERGSLGVVPSAGKSTALNLSHFP